jgi:hypothetical protein
MVFCGGHDLSDHGVIALNGDGLTPCGLRGPVSRGYFW